MLPNGGLTVDGLRTRDHVHSGECSRLLRLRRVMKQLTVVRSWGPPIIPNLIVFQRAGAGGRGCAGACRRLLLLDARERATGMDTIR